LKWQELIAQLFSQPAPQCPVTTTNDNIDYSWWTKFVEWFHSTAKDLMHSCANFNTKVIAAQLWKSLVSNFITLVQRFKKGWQYGLKLSQQFTKKMSQMLRQSLAKLFQCVCTTIQLTSNLFKRFVEFLFNSPSDLCRRIEIHFQGKAPMKPVFFLISAINCILFFFNCKSKFIVCYRKLLEKIQSSPSLLLFISMQLLTFIKGARKKQNSVIIVKSQFQIPSSIVFGFNGKMFFNLSQFAQSEMFYSLMQSPQFNEFAKCLLQEMLSSMRTEEQRKMFNYQSNRLLLESNYFLLESSNLTIKSNYFLFESSNLNKSSNSQIEPIRLSFETNNFTIEPNSLISIDPRNLLVFTPDTSTIESKNSLLKSKYAKSSIRGLTFLKDSYRNLQMELFAKSTPQKPKLIDNSFEYFVKDKTYNLNDVD